MQKEWLKQVYLQIAIFFSLETVPMLGFMGILASGNEHLAVLNFWLILLSCFQGTASAIAYLNCSVYKRHLSSLIQETFFVKKKSSSSISLSFIRRQSGQTNPSVTLVLWSLGRASIQQVLAYIPIQIFGAFVGTATAYLDYLETLNFYDGGRRQIDGPNGTLCFFVTCIAPYSTKLSALFDQIVGTAILCMTMAAMLDPKNGVPKFLHPLFGGLTVLTIGLAFAQNDAYPIHAARDLGARLFMFIIYGKGVWTKDDYYWWVPILGPLIGGFVGAWLYVLFIDFHAWSNREEDEVEL
ncbi:unnamed protein product, partial [Mesorhabditis belari]|uniref:Aquaporin n=1 Tax=Mesorhabditis belari TaxID=2138241 RepID=A0AAF3EUC6_9BILA